MPFSPDLFDPNTVIGRSDPHFDGDASDTGGTPVGTAGTIVSDNDFSLVPDGFEGPPGTSEVHTEIRSLNMTNTGVAVRAGTAFPGLRKSPGEVESKSGASGDPNQDFPAESFFNVFLEIDLPGLGGLPTATLFNDEPLLVVNDNLLAFPPRVVYVHDNTTAVPVLFRHNHPGGLWTADQCFGWLVLAGHCVNFDDIEGCKDEFKPELPVITIGDVTVIEGDSGTTNAVFTVSLSAPSEQEVTVDYATADGTATAGDDYTATAGTVTFIRQRLGR